jgi:uncharacterized protein (DUF4415 family)
MTRDRKKAPPISDEEEAAIQRMIAKNPDDHEMTDEEFASRMTADEALPPGFLAAVRRGRGPGKKPSKKLISLRLDPDVIEAYQADGPGWQVRMNDALRKAKKLPPAA